jgi:hypothetical protein
MEFWPVIISGPMSYAGFLVTSFFANVKTHYMRGSQMRILPRIDWSCLFVIPYAPMAHTWPSDVPFFFDISHFVFAHDSWLGNRCVRFEACKPNAWAEILS